MSWATNIKSAIKLARLLFLRSSLVLLVAFAMLFAGSDTANAQAFTESFTTVTTSCTAPVVGWVADNNSVAGGTSCWFQSNPAVIPGQSGGAISANFNNTTGDNTISNWLMSPNRTFSNGDVITFYTRTVTTQQFPDRLQVRLSLAGTSVNVGTTPTDVGDFTTLLLDINPAYELGVYPSVMTQFTITLSGLPAPTSGRIAFRYFVESGGPLGANSDTIGIDTFAYTPGSVVVPADAPVDMNGDGKTDFVVVRNTGGGPGGQMTWFIQTNGTGAVSGAQWGLATDFFVPVDYDGDLKDDVAVWRAGAPGTAAFYILQSATSTVRIELFGQTDDNPTVVDDYDGDGRADVAVYRSGANSGDPSTWFYRGSMNNPSGNVTYVPWGQNGDFVSPGDYDGDGRADFVIQRNNGGGQARFWMLQTTAGFNSIVFGTPSDYIVPGDYDGDGKTDIATVRVSGGNILWFVRPSSTGVVSAAPYAIFGSSATDFRAQGDYDGDGKTDVAVWRPNADPTQNFFFVLGSTSGFFQSEWGQNGDYPVAAYNNH